MEMEMELEGELDCGIPAWDVTYALLNGMAPRMGGLV